MMKRINKRNVIEVSIVLISTLALFLFRNSLNNYSNLILIWVTIVYVIATIEICLANMNSAKATREQLAESKRQYEETKRIEIMPCFSCYLVGKALTDFSLSLALSSDDSSQGQSIVHLHLCNVGNGTAKEIRYYWHNYSDSYDRGFFPFRAFSSGESKSVSITFSLTSKKGSKPVSIELLFEDLLNNKYSQTIEFDFTKTQIIKQNNLSIGSPILIKEVEQNA